jgi:hypothetical protein
MSRSNCRAPCVGCYALCAWLGHVSMENPIQTGNPGRYCTYIPFYITLANVARPRNFQLNYLKSAIKKSSLDSYTVPKIRFLHSQK